MPTITVVDVTEMAGAPGVIGTVPLTVGKGTGPLGPPGLPGEPGEPPGTAGVSSGQGVTVVTVLVVVTGGGVEMLRVQGQPEKQLLAFQVSQVEGRKH